MIRTVCLNPAIDKTVQVPAFTLDAVNRIADIRVDAGGKGINVSKVVKELGGQTKAYALLAGDAGKSIARMVEAMGIELAYIEAAGETRTNLKIVDGELHTNTDLNEPGPVVRQTELDSLLDLLLSDIEEGDIVVLAGSLPKGAPKDTYASWTTACKQAGAQVFLDADGEVLDAGISAGPTMIKPNDHELAGLVGRELNSLSEIEAAARELIDRGLGWVTVSMGGEGALFVLPDKSYRATSPKVEVGSTVGAGDSVVAALAYADNAGLSLEDSIRLAVATGSANVSMSGTQAAPRSLVDSLLSQVGIEELS
ncbi:MAG: 1-phosphofructokinase [Atopobiaceae bacterium]|nr:1-phosphofructokinase [Atopobiaceae bacterium]